MTELYYIIPSCVDKYCRYDSSFGDGYALGFLIIMIVFVFIEIIHYINEQKRSKEDDKID